MLRQGGQEKVMLAQRLEGGEGMNHRDTWVRAFSAEGTARSSGEHVSVLFKVTLPPAGLHLGK